MARTKQTVRQSTGGKAPKKQDNSNPQSRTKSTNLPNLQSLTKQTGLCHLNILDLETSYPSAYVLNRHVHEGSWYYDWRDKKTGKRLVWLDKTDNNLQWEGKDEKEDDGLRFGFEPIREQDGDMYKIFFFNMYDHPNINYHPLQNLPPTEVGGPVHEHSKNEWEILVMRTGSKLKVMTQPFHFFGHLAEKEKNILGHRSPNTSNVTKNIKKPAEKNRAQAKAELQTTSNWQKLVSELNPNFSTEKTLDDVNKNIAVNLVLDLYRRVTLGYMDHEKCQKFHFGSTVKNNEGKLVGYQVKDAQFGSSASAVLFGKNGQEVIKNLLQETEHCKGERHLNSNVDLEHCRWPEYRTQKRTKSWTKEQGYYLRKEDQNPKKNSKPKHIDDLTEFTNNDYGKVTKSTEKGVTNNNEVQSSDSKESNTQINQDFTDNDSSESESSCFSD